MVLRMVAVDEVSEQAVGLSERFGSYLSRRWRLRLESVLSDVVCTRFSVLRGRSFSRVHAPRFTLTMEVLLDTMLTMTDADVEEGIRLIISRVPATLELRVAERLSRFNLRAKIYSRELKSVVGPVIELNSVSTVISLAGLRRLSDSFLLLEVRTPAGWRRVGGRRALSTNATLEVHRLSPNGWGVSGTSQGLIRTEQGAVVLEVLFPDSQPMHVVLEFLDEAALQVRFYEFERGRRQRPVSTTSRLVSHSYSGIACSAASALCRTSDSPRTSSYTDVTLSPVVMSGARAGMFAFLGFTGAWSGEVPIPESLEFVLGRQQFLFQAQPARVERELPSPIIYLGLPHGSWGHFLTQGLSRVWFALENPDVPVVWDARALPGFAPSVLELLGFNNPMYFLDRVSHAAEVIFPEPGIGLGDYVSADFARRIGKVPHAALVPGRRLFLSRAALSTGRGSLGQERDAQLEALMRKHGFEAYSPERYSVSSQLEALSSAEVVVGVEGSAFHSLLLLENGCRTRFRALSRHRGGGGVFQHIKDAKQLDYETLNFLRAGGSSASSSMELDLDRLDLYLSKTDGLRRTLPQADDAVELPHAGQSTYPALLETAQLELTRSQEVARSLVTLMPRTVDPAVKASVLRLLS